MVADPPPAGLADVVDAVYGGLPEAFVEARDGHARAAKAAGDAALAKAITALRKPTQSAWLANLLVRTAPAEVDALLELGPQLRQAQDTLAGDDLRQLMAQRREVVASLVRRARRTAADAGVRVAEAAGWDLEATLTLALADDAVAAAVRSGRLVSVARRETAVAEDVRAALGPGGQALLTPAAAPVPGPPTGPARGRAGGTRAGGTRAGGTRAGSRDADGASSDDLARRRAAREEAARQAAREAAQRAAEEAEERLAQAEQAAGEAAAVVAEAAQRVRAAASDVTAALAEVAALEARLALSRDTLDTAERTLADARAARVEADAAAAEAGAARDRVRAALTAARHQLRR